MARQEERTGRLTDWLLNPLHKSPNMAFINTKCKLSAIRKQALLWSVESQHTQEILTSTKKHSVLEKKIFV